MVVGGSIAIHFTATINSIILSARVFVSSSHFHPSLIFKAELDPARISSILSTIPHKYKTKGEVTVRDKDYSQLNYEFINGRKM
jgi:hypothetical protein